MRVSVSKALGSFGVVFICVCLSLFIAEYSTLGLPKPNDIGIEDKRSFGFLLLGLITLLSVVGKHIFTRVLIVVLIVAVVALSISNWWYFSFYRSFISISDFQLGLSITESSKSLGAIGQFDKVALLLIGCLLLLTIICKTFGRVRYSKQTMLLVSLIGFFMSSHYYNRGLNKGAMHAGIASHPVMFFLRSVFTDSMIDVSINEGHVSAVKSFLNKSSQYDKFPLYVNDDTAQSDSKYNVIVVLLESLRAAETGVYNKGFSMTPNLDKIAQEHSYITKAYANSIQTVRGEMSIFCGLFDLSQGAPFSSYDLPLQANCLPDILRSHGYETSWFHGYKKEFFRRDTFLNQMGFSQVYDQKRISEIQPDLDIVGWGINDFSIFDFSLNTLEKAKKPFMAEILTLSNHYPFEYQWGVDFSKEVEGASASELKAGNKIYANYLKGINYTDKAVGHFWDKFKNSSLYEDTIVFFVADHSVWTFSQEQLSGNIYQKNEYYFRIPIVFYHPDMSTQKLDIIASQVDIAPTILDMLDIAAPTAFIGGSVFDENRPDKVIMNKIGDYALAEKNMLCVSDVVQCDEHYQRCNIKKIKDELNCTLYSGDVIDKTAVIHNEKTINSEDVRMVIDYSNRGLFHGFVPEEARL